MAQPKGFFKHLLAIDCETTGLCFGTDSPVHNPDTGETHQAVSWGAMVLDSQTLDTVEELYVEVQWTELSNQQREDNPKFGTYAENIHGLTRDHLDEHGMSEEDAVVELVSLAGKYWGPKSPICLLGHNVHLFDKAFFQAMTRNHGIDLRMANRHVDTNSIAFVNWESYTSDQMFELMGFEARKDHNALDDIRMTVDTARIARTIMQTPINQKVLEGLRR